MQYLLPPHINIFLHNLYASPNIIRVMSRIRWVGHVARMGEMRSANKILAGKFERKRPLRRPKHRWEGHIRMDIRDIGWESVDWMHLLQDAYQRWALVNTAINHKMWRIS
jgi:hypothetical protein